MLYSHTIKLVRYYKGVDGLKTGYTESAGFCMTATANIDGMRVITVVMGEKDSKTRNSEVTSIFDYVYAQYALNKVIDTNTVVDTVKIERANIDSVDIIPTENVNSLYKKADGIGNINYEIDVDNLKAPISKGDVVGKLILKQDDQTIKNIDLTVKEDVKKANFFQLYYRYFKNIITMNN